MNILDCECRHASVDIVKSVLTDSCVSDMVKLLQKEISDSGAVRYKLFGKTVYRKIKRKNALVVDKGHGNKISANLKHKSLEIHIHGDNNTVKIDSVKGVSNFKIYIGAPDSRCHNCTITIGDNVTSNGVNVRMMENGSVLTIGDDCMFSSDVFIWCSDTHTITDMAGNIINQGKSIEIGNHVWVGMFCRILKNTRIPDNSVIAMNSVVTKKFDIPNSIYAGVPANLVKSDIKWNRCRPQQYMDATGLN